MVTLNLNADAEKRVLFQADDFGLDAGTNQRIFASWRQGPVRGVSLLVNFIASSRAAAQIALSEGIACGLHFNVSEGRPISERREVPTLVSRRGEFFPPAQFLFRLKRGLIDPADLKRECNAQVAQFSALGLTPYRFDSHHHTHVMPGVFPVLAPILKEAGFRYVRAPTEPLLWVSFFGSGKFLQPERALEIIFLASWGRRLHRYLRSQKIWFTSDYFRGIFEQLPNFSLPNLKRMLFSLLPGFTEIMVHPGHRGELEVLTDERIQRFIVEKDLVLVSP